MSSLNRVLLGVLGVQVALAAITNWPEGGPAEPRDLLGVTAEEIQSITVAGRKQPNETETSPSVKLVREGSGWVLESEEGFPASDALVQPLLDNLGKLKVTDAIATTETSHAGLEVAADAHTRMVEVTTKAGATTKVFLGASQGKTTHVRVDGQREVYDVTGFTAWSLAENANRYFDRDFLKVDPAEVQTLTLQRPGQAPVTFTQVEDVWTMSPNDGRPLDANATTGFVRGLVNVRMLEPEGKQITPEMGLDGPDAVVVTWTTRGADGQPGSSSSYRVGAAVPNESGRFYLKSETSPYVLQVLKGSVANALDKPIDTVYGAGASPLLPPGR
jgi:Domain of unknown function (DUF4340)